MILLTHQTDLTLSGSSEAREAVESLFGLFYSPTSKFQLGLRTTNGTLTERCFNLFSLLQIIVRFSNNQSLIDGKMQEALNESDYLDYVVQGYLAELFTVPATTQRDLT